MNIVQKSSTAGYYLVSLSPNSGKHLLRSNNERAFVISQLQDLLGRRSLLEEPEVRHRLASHLDLLAYSILDQDITCVIFSISRESACTFIDLICHRLQEYQNEWHIAPSFKSKNSGYKVTAKQLAGPHDALNTSVSLHLRHLDWEYDRYSSIGFYLHDRRGDWMSLWKLSQLYENDSYVYRQLLDAHISLETNRPVASTSLPYGPLSHAL